MVERRRNREEPSAAQDQADRDRNLPPDAEASEEAVDEADDAVIDMEAHERRRDGAYNRGGDDHDPGIDAEIDSNAQKELRLPPNKRGKT